MNNCKMQAGGGRRIWAWNKDASLPLRHDFNDNTIELKGHQSMRHVPRRHQYVDIDPIILEQ